MAFLTAEEAIEEIRRGRMVIAVDDEDRENEGDLIMAAQMARPEDINLIVTKARGLLCQAITGEAAERLNLSPMASHNTSAHTTAFTVSVDAREGTTTGISAADRATTIRALSSSDTRSDDLLRPGHIFPLVAKHGGVLERRGHTEAAVDLARLAGLESSGILCEILDDDGSMARLPRLEKLSQELGVGIVTVESLCEYRRKQEGALRLAECALPSEAGEFRLIAYENPGHPDSPHLALVSAKDFDRDRALVRVHSECLTGDTFGSRRCDCGEQLEISRQRIAREGGVLVYLRQEGRGIGLTEKLRAYTLQEGGLDTADANLALGHPVDSRDYSIAAAILRDLGIRGVRLLTNNPAKVTGLEGAGTKVTERLGIEGEARETNRAYLETKRKKFGHMLTGPVEL